MCITLPAQVVAVDAGGATIESDGRRRRAATLLLPDVQEGEWVVVGLGTILARLTATEAQEVRDALLLAARLADEDEAAQGVPHAKD